MRRLWQDDAGSSAVDFVLVGTLLTVLTLAVLQLGLAVYVRNIVHDAAVEGAYHAALADTTTAEGAARTALLIHRAVGDGYETQVTAIERPAGAGGARVEVTVVATMPLLGLLGAPRAWEVTADAPVESLE